MFFFGTSRLIAEDIFFGHSIGGPKIHERSIHLWTNISLCSGEAKNETPNINRECELLHAGKMGYARKACQFFGVGRSSYYRWREAYQKHCDAGLKNAISIPKNPANQSPAEIVEKVRYLRRKYHFGPIRIV